MKSVSFIRNLMVNLWNSLQIFLKNCNLHGVRYIGATDRRVFERILWLALVFGAFAFMAKLSYITWSRFSHSVTVTTITSTSYPVSEVLFPAVAICTNTRYERNLNQILLHMETALNIDENRSIEFINKLKFLIRPFKINMTDVKEIEAGLLHSQITLDFLLQKLVTPCKDLIRRCKLGGRSRNCTNLFRLITTGKGFCCAFNYHGDRRGDANKIEAERTVHRLALAGYDNGLLAMVALGDPEDDHYAEVMVGHPFDFFDESARTCQVGGFEELAIPINPVTVHSTSAVRGVEVNRRRCFFDDEVRLKSSGIYSYATCVTQCRMDQIFKFCLCVPFYYLRDDTRRNCTLSDVNCLDKHIDLLRELRPQNGTDGCNCLPRCTDSWYDTECTLSKLAPQDFITSSFLHRENRSEIGIVSVAWADNLSLKYTRDVSLTWDTFLSSFGGILSLCVGGSVLSVVELIYFMLIRTCTDSQARRLGRRKKNKEPAAPTRQPTLQLFWFEFAQNLVARSKK